MNWFSNFWNTRRIKDSATLLEKRQKEQEQRFPRVPAAGVGAADEPPPLDLDEVQVWDLLDGLQPADERSRHPRPEHSRGCSTTTRRSIFTPPTSKTG